MTADQKAFIGKLAALVQKYAPAYDIKVCSPIIAQGILESAWGKSKLSSKYHNYFGLKCGSKWTGKSVNMTTQEEYTAGTKTTIKDTFRAYESMDEGVRGYFEFIQLDRYKNLRGITDPETYLQTIKADGYATASDYAEDVMKVVRAYNLTEYDQKGESMKWDSTDKAIAAMIATAKAEEGYLEKKDKTAKYLDSKTKNAGSANYTKYWRDLNNWGLFGYSAGWAGGSSWYWCAAFVYWVFRSVFGARAARSLLLHAPYISCATLGDKSKAAKQLKSTPKVGDVVLFWNGSRFSHTGIVYKVDKTKKIYQTIEGNTSGASGVVSNGGGVVVGKSYSYDGSKHRFHRPDYAGVLGITDKVVITPTPSANTSADNVAAGQRWLNKNYKEQLQKYCGGTLKATGKYDAATRNACLAVWKDMMNRKHKTALNPENRNFLTSCKAVADKAKVSANSGGTFTYLVQLILSAKGYYTGAMDGACGAALVSAITRFQIKAGITGDGVCGKETWYRLFN